VNEKAIVFSLEATISLLALLVIVSITPVFEGEGMTELLLLQKENDLLKVWAKQGIPEKNKMIQDFLFVFPGQRGKIVVNEREIFIGEKKQGSNAIASKIIFFSRSLEKIEVVLIVFY